MAEKLGSGKIGVKPCVGIVHAHSGDFDLTELLIENGFLTCPQAAISGNLSSACGGADLQGRCRNGVTQLKGIEMCISLSIPSSFI